ncbi:MAG: hypothetical protein HY298_24835 [Verrucomicrobia bacterium]|nr:hypothetical protein [Verrucomicrobiota bacterium]
MPKIKLDHSRLDTAAYIIRMKEISTALQAAPVFGALGPKFGPFDALIADLETKNSTYNATVQLGRQQLAERDTARVLVEDAARALAMASERETTVESELQSGGWHLRGTPSVVGPMPAPQNLSATGGDQEGEVDLTWDPVDGRDTYIGEQAAAASGP